MRISLNQIRNSRYARLVVCQGPLQLLNVLSSLHYESSRNPAARFEDHLVLFGMCVDSTYQSAILNAINDLAAVWQWAKIVDLSSNEPEIVRAWYEDRTQSDRTIHAKIGVDTVDQVFSARNWQVSNEIVLHAYRDAYQICYGDGLGFVDFIFSPQLTAYQEIRHVMPIFLNDFSRVCDRRNLKILQTRVPKKCILQAIDAYLARVHNLSSYLAEITDNAASLLFLSSTGSESGLMSQEQEIAAYEAALKQWHIPGQRIVIKPHPRESLEKGEVLAERLRSSLKTDVVVMNNRQVQALPVEVLFRAHAFENVISLFSSSIVSLKYLYNANGVLAFDQGRDNFISTAMKEHIVRSVGCFQAIMERHESGNGHDVLYDEIFDSVWRPDVVLNKHGELLSSQKRYGEALQVFSQAHTLNPEYSEVPKNIGIVRFFLNEHQAALDWLKKAYALNDEDLSILENFTNACIRLNDFDSAKTFLMSCLEHKNRDATILNLYLLVIILSDASLKALVDSIKLDATHIYEFLEKLPPDPLYCDSPVGRFVKEAMLSPAGKIIRALLPQFKPWCTEFPGSHIVILSDGSVTTCCREALGENAFASIYEKPVENIWKEDVKQLVTGDLYDLKRCRNCIGTCPVSLISNPDDYHTWVHIPDGDMDSLTIEIMGACNYGCCIAKDIGKRRSVKPDLQRIFTNIQGYLKGIRRLRLFNWGEPLLHDGFLTFIDQCRHENDKLVLLISTNASLMNEAVARAFIAAKVDQVVVSVHGAPGTDNMLRYSRYGADYSLVMTNVQRLLELRNELSSENPKIALRAILFNWNDTDELMDVFRNDAQRLGLTRSWGNPDTDNYHWILDGMSGGVHTSSRFFPGSEALTSLIERREFFMPEMWQQEITADIPENGSKTSESPSFDCSTGAKTFSSSRSDSVSLLNAGNNAEVIALSGDDSVGSPENPTRTYARSIALARLNRIEESLAYLDRLTTRKAQP